MTASERPRDLGGPRPENQRKRTEVRGPRHALTGFLALAGLATLILAIWMIHRPGGGFLRLSPEVLMGSPFGSYRSLGLLLALLLATLQLAAAALFAVHHALARRVAIVAGVVAIAWSVALVMVLARTSWLQPTLFGIGFIELLLVAGSTPRTLGERKRGFGRRVSRR